MLKRNNISTFILRLSLRSFSIFLLIYNHSYPFEFVCLYPSVSLDPRLSFSILGQSKILLIFLNFYIILSTLILFCNINHLYPFESQRLSKSIPRVSMSMFFYSLEIYNSAYLFESLSSYRSDSIFIFFLISITSILLNPSLSIQIYLPLILI